MSDCTLEGCQHGSIQESFLEFIFVQSGHPRIFDEWGAIFRVEGQIIIQADEFRLGKFLDRKAELPSDVQRAQQTCWHPFRVQSLVRTFRGYRPLEADSTPG